MLKGGIILIREELFYQMIFKRKSFHLFRDHKTKEYFSEFYKITLIVTKILEIAHWVAAGFMVAAGVCSAVAPQWLGYFVDTDALEKDAEISVYGFEVIATNSAGEVNMTIALPIIGLIMSITIRIVVGAEATEASIDFGGFIIGTIVLCLTQFFVHGAELEKDVDGLL